MDIAVVVNLHARRGSEAVARRCREHLPNARVLASRSLTEAADFAQGLSAAPPDLLVSAGGDGTAVALLNALRGAAPDHFALGATRSDRMVLGVVPLGTGNAWARVTGAPSWQPALRRLGALSRGSEVLPRRGFDLVEVEGTIAPMAGSGWDAELIEDFHAQKSSFGLLPRSRRAGLLGYLNGLFTRLIPRHLFQERVHVTLTNTGDAALGVDDHGQPFALPGGERGAVLYRGPTSVCAAATTQEWGFGFRAFPFAGLVPGRFCMRVYGGSAAEATLRMGPLWRGAHPLAKMHSWLLTGCHAAFSRPVPFQIGGDRVGFRSEVEFGLAKERVDLLDWSALRS